MKAHQFHVTIAVPDSAESNGLTPKDTAAMLAEIIRHRIPFLYSRLTAAQITVTPEAQ